MCCFIQLRQTPWTDHFLLHYTCNIFQYFYLKLHHVAVVDAKVSQQVFCHDNLQLSLFIRLDI